MVAEMLQKHIFNILLSKKLYIITFNQKIFLSCKNFVIQRNCIYIQSKFLYLTGFFFVSKLYLYSIKKNVFNEIFLLSDIL